MENESFFVNKKFHLLLGITGSVAAIKTTILLDSVTQAFPRCKVRVVITENSKPFIDYETLKSRVKVHEDMDEWQKWKKLGDTVLHIKLRSWADILVVAPLDATTLAKLANGLCDNLLSCIARAWDFKKPFLYAPAMNTFMWEHPITVKHTTILESFGYKQISPVTKKLACSETGLGAMAEVSTIISEIKEVLLKKNLVNFDLNYC
ncbi:phosphopantothenoylcysteine decarboxylase-like [Zophobas morio]|uniref:phosphopantothenoylcysteine decarboxylase-like n=1 Tax=Zophobas morio TaxID=2755281 RepID=UPI0030838633